MISPRPALYRISSFRSSHGLTFQSDLQRLLHGRIVACDPPGLRRLDRDQPEDEASDAAGGQVFDREEQRADLPPGGRRLQRRGGDRPEEACDGQIQSRLNRWSCFDLSRLLLNLKCSLHNS